MKAPDSFAARAHEEQAAAIMLRQDLEAHRYGRKLRHRRMSSRANELNSAEWEKQIMKRVLVPLTGRPPDRRALTAAFLVAERFRGHIDGLCVMPHAEFHTPVESTALPAALTRRLTKIAQEGQAQFVTAARQTFDDYSTRHGAAMTPEAGVVDADS
ncbi:MAG TPA: hypothetical protein VNC62_07660 [Burkholderiales bacterium]|nr:hypothetical protein [Burkholderiales bacterium]